MKWIRFCLFLLVLPSLLFALKEKECRKIHQKAVEDYQEGGEIVKQISALQCKDCDAWEKRLKLLEAALACFEKAKQKNDTILIDIKNLKHTKDKHLQWRVISKQVCQNDNKSIISTIEKLQNEIKDILQKTKDFSKL